MLIGLWMTATWVGSVNQAAGGAPPRLALSVTGAGDAVRIHWKEESGGDWARLESAALVIRRNGQEETLDLLDRYVPDGGVEVPMQGGELVVRLRVRRDGLPVAIQAITYVVPEVAAPPKNAGELKDKLRKTRK